MIVIFKNYYGLTAAYNLDNIASIYIGENDSRLAVVLEDDKGRPIFIHVNEGVYVDSEERWQILLKILSHILVAYEEGNPSVKVTKGESPPVFIRSPDE